MESIRTDVSKIFKKVFKNENIEITDSMTANDVEGWDSLTHMDLISAVEQHFNIRFGLKDLARMNSVGALITIIHAKVS